MAGRVQGKVAFVTGAGRGIGRAIAVRLAQEGADVIALDLGDAQLPGIVYDDPTSADLEETAEQVKEAGGRVVPVVADVRDLAGMRRAVDAAVGDLGRLDIVVPNAAICTPAPWHEVTSQQFQDTMDINVTGTWNTVMVGAPHLVRAGSGSVVIVSSAAGLKVQPFMVHYTTSKFAVRGMAKAFAAELAKDGVRVNTVHPTGVATPMGSGGMQDAIARAVAENPRLAVMFTNMLPVDVTQPEDIAAAVLYLASDEGRYVTAHELAVDAGVTEM